jgi:hypothetical protein
MELGRISAVDCEGRTMWIVDAHRDEIVDVIGAGSFAVRQSKRILARSCEAKSVSLCGRMKS